MEKNTKVKILVFLGLFFVLLGTTYALFSYFNTGNNEISIYSNGISFNYKEGQKALNLENAIPIPDEQGKIQNDYFEFDIKAKSNKKIEIPYYITARKSSSSSNIDEAIKLYLTRIDDNGNEEEVALVKYSELSQYENAGIDLSKYVEKLLYNTEVPVDKNKYHETYRLRMWIDLEANFNDAKYKNATFSIKVNVYALGREAGIEIVKSYIAKANSYYDTVKNNQAVKLGTNVIDRLNLNDISENDQIVLTEDGKVEVAVVKNGKCYRKSALSDDIDILEEKLCNASIQGFESNNGKLHVTGTKIMNQYNEEIRLMGASGSDIYHTTINPSEISYNSINTLKNWGANVFRFFTNANTSYAVDYIEDPDACLNLLKQVIDNIIANDMYILVTWSGMEDQGMFYSDYALDFFTKVAALYPNNPHILYEIWNEPLKTNTWTEIKEYANKIIPAIRTISPDSIVIVGTPNMSSNLNVVIGDMLDYPNIMYTHHTYMNGFSSATFETIENALNAGVPVFETEWGTASTVKGGDSLIEPLANAFVGFLNKHNLSNIMFAYTAATGESDARFCITNRGEWDEKLPDSVLTKNGKYMKKVLGGNYNFSVYQLADNASTSVGNTYRSEEWKDKIVSIEFKNKKNVPSNAVVEWDLSMAQDETIIGYLVNAAEADTYKLVIAANGKINAPIGSENLFANLSNLKSIDFTNFTTYYLETITSWFKDDTNLESLDLSGFNTDTLIAMWSAFHRCTNLKSINFTGWHPNLSGIANAFYGCENITSLDLTNFNVDKVTSFASIFEGMNKLKTLNISTWNPTKTTSVKNMFNYCTSLEKADMRLFNITEGTDTTLTLNKVKKNATFIVNNQNVIDLLNPTANNELNFVIKN